MVLCISSGAGDIGAGDIGGGGGPPQRRQSALGGNSHGGHRAASYRVARILRAATPAGETTTPGTPFCLVSL